MNHDLEEFFTGDMPFLFKRAQPAARDICKQYESEVRELYNIRDISHNEQLIVKWADLAEMALHAIDNHYQEDYKFVLYNCMEWFKENPPPNTRAEEIYNNISDQAWEILR